MPEERTYRVTFVNQGQVYEIYASSVTQGGLFGFVEVAGLLFGERSQVVIDPSEESLRTEFKGVERVHLPIQSIVRIDEVEKRGPSRITPRKPGDNLAAFPTSLLNRPDGEPPKKE